MLIKKSFYRINESHSINVEYNTVEECPNCKKALAPQNLYGVVHKREENDLLSVADYCNGCHTMIVTEYEISPNVINTFSDGTHGYSEQNII